jgi:hypothetical protein
LNKQLKILFIGTYIPKECGIATSTSDLLHAVSGEYNNVDFGRKMTWENVGIEYNTVFRKVLMNYDTYPKIRNVFNIPSEPSV